VCTKCPNVFDSVRTSVIHYFLEFLVLVRINIDGSSKFYLAHVHEYYTTFEVQITSCNSHHKNYNYIQAFYTFLKTL